MSTQVAARLGERGFALDGDRLVDERDALVPITDEAALYAHAGLAFVPPELREGRGELESRRWSIASPRSSS